MLETNKIYKMETMDFLKQLPDGSVDLILTDPPYNISKLNDNRDRSKLNSPIMRRESPLKYDFGDWDNKTREEFLEFTQSWLYECCRVLKDGGTIISFFNKEDISFLGWTAREFGIRTRTILSWHKTNPVPSFRKVNYLSACEFLWVGSKGEKSWTFNFKQQKEMHNFFESPNKSSYGKTKHPTEKPLSLIKHLIEIHSNPQELVVDCFMGSGTTAVASKQLGRDFVGCEINEDYIEMAESRLSETASQLTLNPTDLTFPTEKAINMGLTASATPSPKCPSDTSPSPNIKRKTSIKDKHSKEINKGDKSIIEQ